ncbi:MAG: flotillin-like FloA family protein [Eubacteriales bacterium]|nr:flotillin-like FloA family protein [Eubacteriales bacterium]
MNFLPWVIVLVLIIAFLTFCSFFNMVLWIRALISGAHISVGELISMTVKKLDARSIVNIYIKARKAGVNITIAQIENHLQAHGNIESVINALIAAQSANLEELDLKTAIAVDLSGRDINDAVKHRIMPQIIQINNITAMAKNGIEVSVSVKVTVRVNLKRIIGGALEETIIARISEGIMTIIGNAATHNEILEAPNIITKTIMANKDLAADTAFDVLSLDIVDMKVGRNIGAELEIDKAEAVKYISQADAEKRRAEAVAAEQEMRALTQEMRARVVAAESEVPRALAGALKYGNIDVKDYMKMENIQSDTLMRKALSGAANSDMLTPALNPPKKKTKLQ